MRLASRIIGFNLLHIAVLLFANLSWGMFRVFVLREVDPDIAKLDLFSKVISLIILSIIGAWSLGLYVILLAIALIQLVSVVSLQVGREIPPDRERRGASDAKWDL